MGTARSDSADSKESKNENEVTEFLKKIVPHTTLLNELLLKYKQTPTTFEKLAADLKEVLAILKAEQRDINVHFQVEENQAANLGLWFTGVACSAGMVLCFSNFIVGSAFVTAGCSSGMYATGVSHCSGKSPFLQVGNDISIVESLIKKLNAYFALRTPSRLTVHAGLFEAGDGKSEAKSVEMQPLLGSGMGLAS